MYSIGHASSLAFAKPQAHRHAAQELLTLAFRWLQPQRASRGMGPTYWTTASPSRSAALPDAPKEAALCSPWDLPAADCNVRLAVSIASVDVPGKRQPFAGQICSSRLRPDQRPRYRWSDSDLHTRKPAADLGAAVAVCPHLLAARFEAAVCQS